MMWYGVLGTKELLHRTYKNLEQKVLLEVSWRVSCSFRCLGPSGLLLAFLQPGWGLPLPFWYLSESSAVAVASSAQRGVRVGEGEDC